MPAPLASGSRSASDGAVSWSLVNSPLVLLDLVISATLLVAAGSKVRAPLEVQAAFTSLGIPARLNRRALRAAFPWCEALLGLLVLVTWGRVLTVVGAVATVLMATYLLLVVRVIRSGAQAQCACFGTFSAGTIGPTTVLRNVLLTVAAASVILDGILGGGVLSWIADADGPSWGWLGASALASACIGAILFVPSADRRGEHDGQATGPTTVADAELLDYVRLPIPYVALETVDGQRRYLREMTRTGPLLLIFVSFGCSSCLKVLQLLPQWQREIPITISPVVYLHTQLPPEVPDGLLLDEGGEAMRSLDMVGNPSAVLLGADGLLAGGPVLGAPAIEQLVRDIAAELVQ